MDGPNGQAPQLRRRDGSRVRVLVVDDEATLSDLVSMALRYEGWDVRSAGDGLSAVRFAREFAPDAVVLDIMLPDLDRLEVLRRMRADAPEVPVVPVRHRLTAPAQLPHRSPTATGPSVSA